LTAVPHSPFDKIGSAVDGTPTSMSPPVCRDLYVVVAAQRHALDLEAFGGIIAKRLADQPVDEVGTDRLLP
jgi:hypothetical protein